MIIITELERRRLIEVLEDCFHLANMDSDNELMIDIGHCVDYLQHANRHAAEDILP